MLPFIGIYGMFTFSITIWVNYLSVILQILSSGLTLIYSGYVSWFLLLLHKIFSDSLLQIVFTICPSHNSFINPVPVLSFMHIPSHDVPLTSYSSILSLVFIINRTTCTNFRSGSINVPFGFVIYELPQSSNILLHMVEPIHPRYFFLHFKEAFIIHVWVGHSVDWLSDAVYIGSKSFLENNTLERISIIIFIISTLYVCE